MRDRRGIFETNFSVLAEDSETVVSVTVENVISQTTVVGREHTGNKKSCYQAVSFAKENYIYRGMLQPFIYMAESGESLVQKLMLIPEETWHFSL
jgi:hypothetical protein